MPGICLGRAKTGNIGAQIASRPGFLQSTRAILFAALLNTLATTEFFRTLLMILFMTQRRSFLALGLLGLLGASAAVSSADTTRAVALAELQSSASINVSVGTILDFSALNAMVVSSDAPAVVQVTDGSHAKALSPGVANIYVTVSGCPAGAMPCNAMGVAYHITVSAAD